jgi:glutathione S-transferase
VLWLLHDLGGDYSVEMKEPSYFLTTHNTLGPSIIDRDFLLIELETILRYLAATLGPPSLLGRTPRERAEIDQLLEISSRWWQASMSRVARIGVDPDTRHNEISNLRRTLTRLNERLNDREYLAGPFSLADYFGYMLGAAPMLGIDLSGWPAVQRYIARLTSRPTWREAQDRSVALGFSI